MTGPTTPAPAAWLARLRDATPFPPALDDVDALLGAWASVAAARQAVLDDPHRPTGFGPEVAPLVAELELRHDAWQGVLAAARLRVGAHRVHATQIRRYQRSTGPAEP